MTKLTRFAELLKCECFCSTLKCVGITCAAPVFHWCEGPCGSNGRLCFRGVSGLVVRNWVTITMLRTASQSYSNSSLLLVIYLSSCMNSVVFLKAYFNVSNLLSQFFAFPPKRQLWRIFLCPPSLCSLWATLGKVTLGWVHGVRLSVGRNWCLFTSTCDP